MWPSYRSSFLTEDRKTEAGSISVPLILLSLILSSAAISTIGYALVWKSKAALQLRLDRCVDGTAVRLTEIQNRIEASNLRMKVERAAAAAAAVPSFGASLQAVKAVLLAEMAFQEIQRTAWIVAQGVWIVRRGCDGRTDLFLPLPSLHWFRPPPDSVGVQPLEWKSSEAKLEIRLWKGNRFSQGVVEEADGKKLETFSGSGKWRPRWCGKVCH